MPDNAIVQQREEQPILLIFNQYTMKKIVFICLLSLIFTSCSKTGVLVKPDCSNRPISVAPAPCNGSICQNDTCKTYYGIWKDIFLSKSNLTGSYFDNHITVCNTATYKHANLGLLFEITYKFAIDWFEVTFEEGFMILLDPQYLKDNPTIHLPANILLTKDQINANINNSFFSDPIHTVSAINHLKYSSRQEALKVLANAAGIYDFCDNQLSIQYRNFDNLLIGHPVLTASAAINWNENKCISGTMDLATGYLKIDSFACYIDFCFIKGTKITQMNNQTKSIEMIQAGDTILSVNPKTMKIESDIVREIDSIKHSDIVRISFNDNTVNSNTYDHPYYVKNKGWCSYKPLQTEQKYNIKTNQLLIGDTCLKYKNNQLIEVRIKNIKEQPGEVMTYNISLLERNKSYFANGILVSNEKTE